MEIGQKFVREAQINRVKAFEDWASDIMSNLSVLVASRIVTLDSVSKIVSGVHTMIGAPKKKTEAADVDPLKHLHDWLNRGDVVDFSDVAVVPVTGPDDDGEEEEDAVGS